jgi:competence protein ComEC
VASRLAGLETWSSFVAKLRDWIRAEAGTGRLLPWVPVAFGTGIALYFTADREPVFSVTAVPAARLCGLCWAMRRHRLFAVSVLVAAVAAGFAPPRHGGHRASFADQGRIRGSAMRSLVHRPARS